jgi:hypothetical protein
MSNKPKNPGEPAENRTPFMPPKPRMGKIVQVGTDTYVLVIGNVSKPDVLGLQMMDKASSRLSSSAS